jgi:hypothetical protein
MKNAGRITELDLSKYNTAHVVIEPKGMTQKELYDGYLHMYRKFYSFHNIIRRMPLSKPQRRPYLLFNIFYRKFGKVTSALARLIPMRIIGRLAERIAYHVK